MEECMSVIKFPKVEDHAPSLEKLFANGTEHSASLPLSLIREELIVLKAQLKSMSAQLNSELKKNYSPSIESLRNERPKFSINDVSIRPETQVRIIPGPSGSLGTLVVNSTGNGHKNLFKSRPSSSRQRGSSTQPSVGIVSPSTFWSFIESSGYFKELGEEDLRWLETSEEKLAAPSAAFPSSNSNDLITIVPPKNLIERLLSALLEECKDFDKNGFIFSTTNFLPSKCGNQNTPPIAIKRKRPWEGLCDRILWDLRSVGIIGPIAGEVDATDEISTALRKCQSELAQISKRNQERKKKIFNLLVEENFLPALEYYRILDELNRGIEAAFTRRSSAASGSPAFTAATGSLIIFLNKKALLLKSFKHAQFPKRSEMLRNLDFAEGGPSQLSLIQRVAGSGVSPLSRLLLQDTLPALQQPGDGQIKLERKRKKKVHT